MNEENMFSEGIADIFYMSQPDYLGTRATNVNISPKAYASVDIKHKLAKSEGLVYIITDDELREKGVYILDSILPYDGEKRIKVNLFNYGTKPVVIDDQDVICSLILNAIEVEEGD